MVNFFLAVSASSSASLWGCELKFYWKLQIFRKQLSASLWGCELKCSTLPWSCLRMDPSASLWGCELKSCYYLIEAAKEMVSLLVRLWVEILLHFFQDLPGHCQPPCEAVSWNLSFSFVMYLAAVSLLVRLWVEISISYSSLLLCAVSLLVRLWVEIPLSIRKTSVSSSASLWGCELKCWLLVA